ncbi:MAG: hypothetical protein UY67_C0036G0002 [Candidatus Kaiserbacteria bacterium GW2011_GWA2_52_12]|uniref:DUF3761 domain-containing protein n=1 Tax=Candidatus Kaiserbacteria bacterium GW2011_GWA2_52_12 TaxID=1618671 RepID=A0A0G1Z5J3_9BACT|nr:MAG: hypothetical protein UY67_C0036G0002 [Candidatus Kaiserbacteria bacterium GW2011_GWA2_52_12]
MTISETMKKPLSALFLVAVVFSLVGAGCEATDTSSYLNSNTTDVRSTTPVVVPPSDELVNPPVFNPTTVPVPAPEGTYKNVDGNIIPSPYYAPSAPAGATAQCRDGTYSFSQNRRGTCSHHGGVAEWL